MDQQAKRKNTTKARVRSKVEHAFRILKRTFGFTKVRYRGIGKNHQWLCAAFALVKTFHRYRRHHDKQSCVTPPRRSSVPTGHLLCESGRLRH